MGTAEAKIGRESNMLLDGDLEALAAYRVSFQVFRAHRSRPLAGNIRQYRAIIAGSAAGTDEICDPTHAGR